MAALDARRRAPQPRDRRGLLPGASRDVRRPAGRHDRRRRRVQLLSDEEPRRARRRRRGRHQRRARWPTALKRLRNGGQTDRYHHVEPGVNSRLDEMQAAILRARLPRLRGWTDAAPRAGRALPRARSPARRSTLPPECDRRPRLSSVRRPQRPIATRCRRTCAARGIETLIHYPVPIPRQPALAARASGRLPGRGARCAARCSRCRFIPRLRDDDVDAIAAAVHAFQPRTVVS